MKPIDYDTLSLDDLKRYVLTHRDDDEAFYKYVDRSKAEGRMITVDTDDPDWEDKITQEIVKKATGGDR